MGWSTRELAELAGTTVKAVRHYHRVGVLDEPEREANGYKQYRTSHLVRLVRITRLRALGVPLKDIGAEHPEEALRATHAELGATIERLQRMRDELAVILEHRVPLDTPSEFGTASGELGPRDRALLTVFSRVWQDESLGDLSTLASEPREYEAEFETLPEDADDATIEALAVRVAAAVREDHARFPWLRDPGAASPRGKRTADSVVARAFVEHYHAAQIRVLARASELAASLAETPADAPEADAVVADVARSGTVSAGAAQPDAVTADTAQPDAVTADTAQSDAVTADTARPDVVAVDPAQADATQDDAVQVDAASGDPVRSDAG